MQLNLFRLVLLPLFLPAILITAGAQSKPSKELEVTPPGFEVHLPVFVLDRKKKPVADLTGADFVVRENGRRQKITSWSDEKTNPPIYLGVLMDTSESTKGKLIYSKEAAKTFLYTVLKLRKDKAAFLTFDNEINLFQDFTDKTDLLDKAVDKVGKTGSQTALYDAVWQFCDEKLRSAPGRRALVVISDGPDTISRAELEDAIDIAQRTDTVVYIISTYPAPLKPAGAEKSATVPDPYDQAMMRLAAETGGAVFFSGSMVELEKACVHILRELRNQYIITYRPANRKYDGKLRRVEVRLKDKKKRKECMVRNKTNYRLIHDALK